MIKRNWVSFSSYRLLVNGKPDRLYDLSGFILNLKK
ncbi:hypothetical protein H4V97_000351 [Flavobacterium sp. CG_23.5]|nr:hypothetical protein [Flavobacterium sp. CG_9.10]MBP2282033.1 hypothetical protein [Flavobacterium sp. CG_23.5]